MLRTNASLKLLDHQNVAIFTADNGDRNSAPGGNPAGEGESFKWTAMPPATNLVSRSARWAVTSALTLCLVVYVGSCLGKYRRSLRSFSVEEEPALAFRFPAFEVCLVAPADDGGVSLDQLESRVPRVKVNHNVLVDGHSTRWGSWLFFFKSHYPTRQPSR